MKRYSTGSALIILCILSLGGCYHCDDGLCDVSHLLKSEDFGVAGVPAVRLNRDSVVQFEAPSALRRYRHYAIGRIYVYEEGSQKVIWKIESNYKPGRSIEDEPQYDVETPILYGKLIDGTIETVAPQKMEIGRPYNMRGDFVGYDTVSVTASTYVKATFRLVRKDGNVVVESLPTKRAQ